MNVTINLYTSYYNEKSSVRRQEIDDTLLFNLKNPSLNKVIVLNEGGDLSFAASEKLEIISISKRPSYHDLFRVGNNYADDFVISIIANSDIIFDENIAVLRYLDLDNKCFAISRWNIAPHKIELYDHCDSQDAWVFKGKIKNVVSDFLIGVPRCDNRILYELRSAGYTVYNPAYSIVTKHNHHKVHIPYSNTNLKHYVDPPYAYLYPHNQFNLIQTVWFNLIHAHKLNAYKYDIKKVNRWLFFRIVRKMAEIVFNKKLTLIGYE